MAEYFTYKEAMQYLGMKSLTTLRSYISKGLPTIQINGSKRISKSAIDKFMADHTVVVGKGK